MQLLRDFPDRFVIGSGQHYPPPANGPQRWERAVQFLADRSHGSGRRCVCPNYYGKHELALKAVCPSRPVDDRRSASPNTEPHGI